MMSNRTFTCIIPQFIICFALASCSNDCGQTAEKIELSRNWKLQSSDKTEARGEALSISGADTEGWYRAQVPSTVMGALSDNGLYGDLLTGVNYKQADRSVFDVPWWYRTEFRLTPEQAERHISLEFDGISYRANIWLNGEQIASKEACYGTFRRHKFDISGLAKGGENVLAVEVFRAQKGEPNIGFVDWNPRPLDENMGIFREVALTLEGSVGMRDTWVRSKVNIETLKQASISVQTDLENYTDKEITGKLKGVIEDIEFSIPVTLDAREKKTVKITEADVPGFAINDPRLWWCANMGAPELYELNLKFVADNEITAEDNITFGIRDFQSYLTEEGHKGVKLNGRKVLIKGAGWTDDIFLRDTPQSNETQVRYVKDMNLNCIRFENVWGNSRNIYDLCDRYGIIAIVGWSCHWEWEPYFGAPDDRFGCINSEHDMNLVADYWRDQLTWLRNHASIAVWMGGSDKIPNPTLERRYLEINSEVDDRVYIAAAKAEESEVSGKTGMKMLGPYEYVGPDYWFVDKQLGGGYGFNTETGPGAQLPVIESIRKMIPADKLWPLNEVWDYHCTTSTTALNSMEANSKMVEGMYGKAGNLKDYLDRSHLSNYQSTKSMFEAFRINKAEATGIIQWMLNSAWPSIYWQLYDFEKIPVPAYYGVKRANSPLQLIYNYADNGIYAVNDSAADARNMKALIKAYGADSKLIYEKSIAFSLSADKAEKIADIDNSAPNTLLFMEIRDESGQVAAENFYALSSVKDAYDWDKTSWVGTPMKSYGDFKALTRMPRTKLEVSLSKTDNGIMLNLENRSQTIALFTQFLAKDRAGEVVHPVFWEDNYISLQPGEKRTLKCDFAPGDPGAEIENIKISGWNIEEMVLPVK